MRVVSVERGHRVFEYLRHRSRCGFLDGSFIKEPRQWIYPHAIVEIVTVLAMDWLAERHDFTLRAGIAAHVVCDARPVVTASPRAPARPTREFALARNLECDKDTVCHWLPRVGRHCLRL